MTEGKHVYQNGGRTHFGIASSLAADGMLKSSGKAPRTQDQYAAF